MGAMGYGDVNNKLWAGTGDMGRYWRTQNIIDKKGSDGYWECGVQETGWVESGWVLRAQVGLSSPHLRPCSPLQ